jgi:hypothetical protein
MNNNITIRVAQEADIIHTQPFLIGMYAPLKKEEQVSLQDHLNT